jgi:hypothetical protein
VGLRLWGCDGDVGEGEGAVVGVWQGLSKGLTDVLWGSLIVSMILWICFLVAWCVDYIQVLYTGTVTGTWGQGQGLSHRTRIWKLRRRVPKFPLDVRLGL